MMDVLVPIFVCVVLPVAIVGIYYWSQINAENKRAEILMKAIEANCGPDADKLAEALQQQRKPKTAREILNLRLLRGCMFTLIGLGLCAIGIVSLCLGYGYMPESFNALLIFGAPILAIGISYLVVYFVTRKQVKD